ncbi:RNase adapter RapZ [Kribbia dieselivorans]|uniref:RNase adapter RapZ n=1 Tax=Kribbia dieselivorans TaxID=331526 RepID=UPI000ABA9B16|nr:RNase adapter RapZ [Kribbia dieselivorans]
MTEGPAQRRLEITEDTPTGLIPTFSTHDQRFPRVEFVIITGMSGAGRSTAAKVLEDGGWYVIDNLPPQLLTNAADLAVGIQSATPGESIVRVAVVVDVRSRNFFSSLDGELTRLVRAGWRPHLVFLDATDEALVRRFESVRRPHPLQGEGRLLDGIHAERETLAHVRSRADVIIDTSGLNVHQLARKIAPMFTPTKRHRIRMAVVSFGFKYGVPLDADFVFDMRFLPNPYWVPELRAHTGRDQAVAEFVMRQEGAMEFLERVEHLLEPVVAGYVREERRYVTVAVGCTGGKHRSVAMAEALTERLRNDDTATFVVHRDLGRE